MSGSGQHLRALSRAVLLDLDVVGSLLAGSVVHVNASVVELRVVARGVPPKGVVAELRSRRGLLGLLGGISAFSAFSALVGADLIGLPSVLAAEGAASYHLVGDARRKSYFYAEVVGRQLLHPPELIDRDALDQLLENEGHRFVTFDAEPPAPGIERSHASAEILARLAAALTEAEIEDLASAPVMPHYMSAPFVTQAKKRV